MRILILEARDGDDAILSELFAWLSERTDIQIVESSHKLKHGANFETQVLLFSDLEIRLKEQIVYQNGRLIPMSHYEFSTLSFLAKHPGWVFSKQQIYEAVWKEPVGDGNAAITNIISQIRKKLHPDGPKSGYIKTVVNSGYKFEAKII